MASAGWMHDTGSSFWLISRRVYVYDQVAHLPSGIENETKLKHGSRSTECIVFGLSKAIELTSQRRDRVFWNTSEKIMRLVVLLCVIHRHTATKEHTNKSTKE